MAGLIARVLRLGEERPSPPTDGVAEAADWSGTEAQVQRELDTLQVAYALRTISRERYEERRRRILSRLGGGAGRD